MYTDKKDIKTLITNYNLIVEKFNITRAIKFLRAKIFNKNNYTALFLLNIYLK